MQDQIFFVRQLHYLRGNSAGGQDVLGVSTEDIELMQYTGIKRIKIIKKFMRKIL